MLAVRQEEEGATSQGVWEASRSWKRQEKGSYRGVLGRDYRRVSVRPLVFSLTRPTADFRPTDLEGRTLVFFKPPTLWQRQ